MTEKKTVQSQLTDQEMQLIEQLRQNPEIMAPFQSILDITRNADGPLKTDEVGMVCVLEVFNCTPKIPTIFASKNWLSLILGRANLAGGQGRHRKRQSVSIVSGVSRVSRRWPMFYHVG